MVISTLLCGLIIVAVCRKLDCDLGIFACRAKPLKTRFTLWAGLLLGVMYNVLVVDWCFSADFVRAETLLKVSLYQNASVKRLLPLLKILLFE